MDYSDTEKQTARKASAGKSDSIKGVAEAAGKTAIAAALAGAVATGAAAVTPDQINLPEPVPIVQVVDQDVDAPDSVVDDEAEKKTSAWKKILQILKFLLIAAFIIGALVFGVLQGCASCAGTLGVPFVSSESSASSSGATGDASTSGAPGDTSSSAVAGSTSASAVAGSTSASGAASSASSSGAPSDTSSSAVASAA